MRLYRPAERPKLKGARRASSCVTHGVFYFDTRVVKKIHLPLPVLFCQIHLKTDLHGQIFVLASSCRLVFGTYLRGVLSLPGVHHRLRTRCEHIFVPCTATASKRHHTSNILENLTQREASNLGTESHRTRQSLVASRHPRVRQTVHQTTFPPNLSSTFLSE